MLKYVQAFLEKDIGFCVILGIPVGTRLAFEKANFIGEGGFNDDDAVASGGSWPKLGHHQVERLATLPRHCHGMGILDALLQVELHGSR